jgi:hypothetical protein
MSASRASLYQIGGSLQLEAPTYVTRLADRELYEGLRAGEFCYVLNCRQMGKSSLRVRVMARLEAAGTSCVAVQMTDIIDEEITPEQFYAGVIDSITQDLALDFDNMAWWEANGHLSLVNRFSKFLETVLLQRVSGNLVIFIDEIDRVLSMPFKVNGFFAAIRECYNKRADNAIYRRLSFALLGVATPTDLIEDKRSTPFNIGRAIELTGFTLDEAQPLADGLASELGGGLADEFADRLAGGLTGGLANGLGVIDPDEALEAILKWTGGQPFLTQKVCRLVSEAVCSKPGDVDVADWVSDLIDRQIIQNWQSNDEPEHLRTIRDRILQDESRAARRLGLYQQILAQGGLATSSANIDHIELRLSGLVVEQQGRLAVYNPIYAAIFDSAWAAHHLANLRPYTRAIATWLDSDREDKSVLLQGQALSAAKQWSEDKVLPPEDYAFLAASQDLVTEETEEARQTLARANRTLEEANQEATSRIQAANRRLRIGSGILLGAIAVTAIAGNSAFQVNAFARVERQGIALLRRPAEELRDIDMLLDALELGNDLKAIMQRNIKAFQWADIGSYPAMTPLMVLRMSSNSVLETAAFDGEFMSFSEDGQRLVTSSGSDNQSRLYDLSGKELAAFEGIFPSFSEDGQRLIVYSSEDKISRFYDLSGQSTGLDLRGEFGEASPDQKYLITTVASEDISLVYDASGKLLAESPGSLSGQGDLGFTPDSRQILTKTNDGFYHLWPLDNGLEDLLARGCDWVRPYLQTHPEEDRAAFCR